MQTDELLSIQGELPPIESTVQDCLRPYRTGMHGHTTLLEAKETIPTDERKHTYRCKVMGNKWEEYLATEQAYKAIYKSPSNSHLYGIRNCRKYAKFARDKNTGDVVVLSDACRDRWCPMCAAEKASYAADQLKAFVHTLRAPRFLTLTLRHDQGTLTSQIDYLQECFRKLRARKYWRSKIKGGVWFLQIKRGHNSGCWHAHLHIILDGQYIEQGRLSALWEMITYGSLVVDIRRVWNPDATANYVSRYVSRPANLSSMSESDQVEVIESLHGRRLCGTFGTAKAVTLTPPKDASGRDYEEIGYYGKVVKDAETCPIAKAIVYAYHKGEPISDEVLYQYVGEPHVVQTNEEISGKQVQYLFDFFKGT